MAAPNGSSTPNASSQRRFSRSVTSSSTQGRTRGGAVSRPARSGSKPSGHNSVKQRSIASSTSARLRKLTVMLSALPSAAAAFQWPRNTSTSALRKP